MKKIIDKILEMHRIGCEIDDQIQTCGVGKGHTPQWHIFKFEDFKRVAENLNGGKYTASLIRQNENSCACSFEYCGVHVMCLAEISEVPLEAFGTN